MADERKPEPEAPKVDVAERAGQHTGNPQVLHTRLFMQLLVLECERGVDPARAVDELASELAARKVAAVIYEDVNAPRRLGVVTWSEQPEHFVRAVRPAINAASRSASALPDWTMLGRTYSTGYEPDLRFWLLDRPVQTVTNEAWPWAVWYPLKRKGAFNRLEGKDQAAILREHGAIGRSYGEQDLAHDIRLACFGIDSHDNDFVIGLIGKDLHPLSHVVQAMRKTRQTAELMEKMGPFFVGHVVRRVS